MEVFGKAPINPYIFITGKTSGYLTWISLVLSLTNLNFLAIHSNSQFRMIAIFISILGLFLIVLSSVFLGKSIRLGLPTNETIFKQSGIYQISRNPMYLGFNMVTISAMIYSLNWVIIALGVYSMITYHLIIIGEEKFLAQRFGERYLNYKKTVRRYL